MTGTTVFKGAVVEPSAGCVATLQVQEKSFCVLKF